MNKKFALSIALAFTVFSGLLSYGIWLRAMNHLLLLERVYDRHYPNLLPVLGQDVAALAAVLTLGPLVIGIITYLALNRIVSMYVSERFETLSYLRKQHDLISGKRQETEPISPPNDFCVELHLLSRDLQKEFTRLQAELDQLKENSQPERRHLKAS